MSRTPRRILLVLDDCGPGDALRAAGCLRAVRGRHPDARIVLLVSEQAREAFDGSRLFDRVIVSGLYRRGLPPWRRSLHKAREGARLVAALGVRHDLVIVLGWGTSTLDLLGRLVGRRVFGYPNRWPAVLAARMPPYDPDGDPIQQNAALLAAAGIGDRPGAAGSLGNAPDRESAARLLSEHHVRSGADVVVLHPGSDWACQQWSIANWAELATRIVDRYQCVAVWAGLEDEAGYIDEIRARMGTPSISLAGRTSLSELGGLLAIARLCVCVDSAVYELSQEAGVATIALAGPTAARPTMAAGVRPIVLNRTPPALGLRILACQRQFHDGTCHDYSCPMSQLRDLSVEHVFRAVVATGALCSRATAVAAGVR
ncbi:MAG: glycosyltransferase family 9 protein [Candidatus Dormibacteraceae bacterium]